MIRINSPSGWLWSFISSPICIYNIPSPETYDPGSAVWDWKKTITHILTLVCRRCRRWHIYSSFINWSGLYVIIIIVLTCVSGSLTLPLHEWVHWCVCVWPTQRFASYPLPPHHKPGKTSKKRYCTYFTAAIYCDGNS